MRGAEAGSVRILGSSDTHYTLNVKKLDIDSRVCYNISKELREKQTFNASANGLTVTNYNRSG